MSELKEITKYFQRSVDLTDDGVIGRNTRQAVANLTARRYLIKSDWSFERKLIAYVQLTAQIKYIEVGTIDGLIGPSTLFALDQLLYLEEHNAFPKTWRDEDNEVEVNKASGIDLNPHNFPKYGEIESYYGAPTTGLITVKVPFDLRVAWDTSVKVSKITCHKKVSESLTGILESSLDHYGLDAITEMGIDLFGGCFNYRKMRGGEKLSTHAWGISVDLDPMRNQLKWDKSKAQFAKPEYDFLLEAFKKEGWVSLGEAKDYDWMHMQALKV